MKLSYTQEYYLCAVDAMGELKTKAILGTLFAGALLELNINRFIEYTQKTEEVLIASMPLGDSFLYLKPLYDLIASQEEPLNVNIIADIMINSNIRKKFISSMGASLATLGYADELISKGFFKAQTKYAPKANISEPIIKRVRAEFNEGGELTDKTFCLTLLLNQSNIIQDYYRDEEVCTIKNRLYELRDNKLYILAETLFDVVMEYGLRVHP